MVQPWSGPKAQAARRRVINNGRANGTPCHICKQPIDYNLPSDHPYGCSVEHIKPRSLYPQLTWDPTNWAPAHLHCNKAAGTNAPPSLGTTSRQW